MAPASPLGSATGVLEDPVLTSLSFAILLFPLVGFFVLAVFGDLIRDQEKQARRKGESGLVGWTRVHGTSLAMQLACVMVVLSFVCAVLSTLRLMGLFAYKTELRFAQPYLGFEWIDVAGFRVNMNLLLDPLSAVMILTVTGVGSLIHIYSLGYMEHDEERVRYFSYLNLFTFFMLVLVLGGNLPLVFVGWEGVGLCSYLLIGFWFKKKSASDAGKKAFIVNRIGDAGLILGMILAFWSLGTLDLVDITENIGSKPAEAMGQIGTLTAIALMLFVGACGKSAQIPLHVWLPDAMEGPTPVSALIHAATMVTAGVYMVARLAPLYHQAPTAMAVVAVVGAVTALMAATIALVQTDIKRVLAYSTVSQLGYMFLACGVGAFGVGIFHLFTHAFFKALLFLGSGSVIHALSGEQDMRRMGGLWRKIPWTFGTFVVGTAAIAGVPFLAGFYSKDEILANTLHAGKTGLFAIGLVTALLTAFYMTRLLALTFFGSYRGELLAVAHAGGHQPPVGHEPAAAHGADSAHAAPAGHGHAAGGIHESPWTMLGPLVILAIGSLVGGLVPIPRFVAPSLRLPAHAEAHAAWLPWVATAVAAIGIIGASYLYLVYTDVQRRLAASFGGPSRVFEAKYFFDDVYDAFSSRVVVGGSEGVLWRAVDAKLIDGAVNGVGRLASALAAFSRSAQTGLVRGYALVILGGAVAVVGYLVWR
jgi:NADH-quinone oxidoreductase subunit L